MILEKYLFPILAIAIITVCSAQEWTKYDFLNGFPVSALAADQDTLWIGSLGGGIGKLNTKTGEHTLFSTRNSLLPDSNVYVIAIDSNGNKWIGTKKGLIKAAGDNWTLIHPGNSTLPDSCINTAAVSPSGILWLGTENRGLVKKTETSWVTYTTINSGLKSNNIASIAFNKNNNLLWASTGTKTECCLANATGIVRFNGTNWSSYNTSNSNIFDNGVTALAVDDTGLLWAAHSYSLAYCREPNWFSIAINLSSPLRVLVIDKIGAKWLGASGLLKYDGVHWTHFNPVLSANLQDSIVTALTIDDDNRKWIGTFSGEIASFREETATACAKKPASSPRQQIYLSTSLPSTVRIHYVSIGEDQATLTFHNLQGKLVAHLNNQPCHSGSNNFSMSTDHLASGVYICGLRTSSGSLFRKVVLTY